METSMDRTALAAALAAGLLAPAGGMADDQEPVDRGAICGEPKPNPAPASVRLEARDPAG